MLKIKNIKIGLGYKPIIIAEISGNHNGSLKRAIQIVRKAASCGADGIKLQTYTPDTMTLNSKKRDFFINDKKSLWYGKSLYNLYKSAHTPWEWHKVLFKESKKLGLIYFSTSFDETSLKFLKQFNLPIHKVASFENTDLRLIKLVAKTKKPIILSTGLGTMKEVQSAIEILRKGDPNLPLVVLQCTSQYPTPFEDLNLNGKTRQQITDVITEDATLKTLSEMEDKAREVATKEGIDLPLSTPEKYKPTSWSKLKEIEKRGAPPTAKLGTFTSGRS